MQLETKMTDSQHIKKTDILKKWLEQKISSERKQTIFQPNPKTKKIIEPYYIRAGKKYKRINKNSNIETAEILGFYDNNGITHVRFKTQLRNTISNTYDKNEPKILSFKQFSQIFDITKS